MILLMESSVNKERFVISAENITYKELFNMIAKSLEKKPPSIGLKKWQAKVYVRLLTFFSFFIGRTAKISMANVHSAFNDRCFSSNKIQDVMGFHFSSVEEAIQRSGLLYRENY